MGYTSESAAAKGSGAIADWAKAVRESNAGQKVANNASGRGWLGGDHAKYLATQRELWARSFSQYVTTKLGKLAIDNPELFTEAEHAEISKAQQVILRGARDSHAGQWTEQDFAAIERAFDEIFRAKGWLR
jgi:hypothetical protein